MRDARRSRFFFLPGTRIGGLVCALIVLALPAGPALASEPLDAPSGDDEQLKVFAKAAPEGVDDLLAIERHVQKLAAKVEAEIANARGKLSNPTFADKAPPAVVEQERKRLADKEAELAQIRAQIVKLG